MALTPSGEKWRGYLQMIEFIISFGGGAICHQFRRVTERMPNGWGQLTSYAFGIISALPFVVLFFDRLQEPNQQRRFLAAYLMGFSSYGAGVAAGWLVDSIVNDDD